ncbi:EscU/YscU/HrcU family type III secretion system export apparatus switch protein, partial [Falsiroseomonas oryziterrae]|uniref:EscU/YscU/HrcU family type III secretion system export apparatus switch protein n=1 Tax=Falsiroseomonas oryziterrae TaxID=2911368 RepID=UPI001F02FBAF
MAESEDDRDAADRSEPATPRRIEKAREQGQVAVSREMSGFAALLLAALTAGTAMTLDGTVLGNPMVLVAGGDISQAATGSLSTGTFRVQ